MRHSSDGPRSRQYGSAGLITIVLCFGTNACISGIKDRKVELSAVGASYKAQTGLDVRLTDYGDVRTVAKVWSVQLASSFFINMLGYIHRLYLVKRQRNLKYS
jgi:hypothetical protein